MRVVLLPRKSNLHLLPSSLAVTAAAEASEACCHCPLPPRLFKLIALLSELPLHTSELSLAPIALIELPVA